MKFLNFILSNWNIKIFLHVLCKYIYIYIFKYSKYTAIISIILQRYASDIHGCLQELLLLFVYLIYCSRSLEVVE